jgi:cyclopropane fatty-acyl-phospholipid synthase-like methyltransferase
LYTIALAEHGADVTGIDLSETSICFAQEEARKAHLSIRYLLQNYLEYTPKEKFTLLTMIFRDFSVLSPQQRKVLLHTFYNSLEEDGSLLFDVDSIDYFNTASEKRSYKYLACNGFWSKDPYYEFINTFKYEKEKLILGKHTVVEKNKMMEIFNWQQCYSIESIEKELNACGLYVAEIYSDVAGSSYHSGANQHDEIAVIAKKIKSHQLLES